MQPHDVVVSFLKNPTAFSRGSSQTEVPDEVPCFCMWRGKLLKKGVGYVYANLDPEEVTAVAEELFRLKEYEI